MNCPKCKAALTTRDELIHRMRAAHFSRQEMRVSILTVEGMVNKQVAEALGMQVGTVKRYLQHARRKTQTPNTMQLVLRLAGLR